ncbi:MAG TPA: hypothetical protein VFO76_03735, partial [Candidatus Kapabacteria bacterium]|nr:hypothetical protein [Candidatus Kapabacteria bacterium]
MTFTSSYAYCRRAVFLLLPVAAAIFIQSCSSVPKTTSETAKKDSISVEVKNADPFSVLDDNGRVDSALVESRLEASRQEWLRALAAEGRKDKNEAIRRFEASIDILNRLIYFPGVSENKDFQELTRSVFEDYEKYVNKID